MKCHILFIVVIFNVTFCYAQQISPIVNDNHSVTFYYDNPNAKQVKIEGSFITRCKSILNVKIPFLRKKSEAMTFEDGIWRYTTDSLSSEMYTYRFVVDGDTCLDPLNKFVVRDVSQKYNAFLIDGSVSKYYYNRDVPHGTLAEQWYPSTLNGMSQRRMYIYTPPCYYNDSTKRYPVLYLLHGSGGDETAWSDYGRACQILDNMIFEGVVKEMIVIMPNGNVNLDAAPGESIWMNKMPSSNNTASMLGKFEKTFMNEIVKFVDNNYRTIPTRQKRAIAGLSLGGLHTLFISANNPDYFNYIGLFSPQTTNILDNHGVYSDIEILRSRFEDVKNVFKIINGDIPSNSPFSDTFEDIDVYENIEQKLENQFSPPPSVYYIAVGKQDFVLKLVKDYRKRLDSKGYKYMFNLTDGGHSWENWRQYLVDFLPLLFN